MRSLAFDYDLAMETAARSGRDFVTFPQNIHSKLWKSDNPAIRAAVDDILAARVAEIETGMQDMGATEAEAQAVAATYRASVEKAADRLRGRADH